MVVLGISAVVLCLLPLATGQWRLTLELFSRLTSVPPAFQMSVFGSQKEHNQQSAHTEGQFRVFNNEYFHALDRLGGGENLLQSLQVVIGTGGLVPNLFLFNVCMICPKHLPWDRLVPNIHFWGDLGR